ncbi:MAG: hypothetical protein R2873_15615 [Caldilineaceae bacterium]
MLRSPRRIAPSLLRRIGFLTLSLLALSLGTFSALQAGVELLRLDIVPLADRVRIEWETTSEYDISAFQLYYKLESEAEAEYKAIGQPITAQGELESGALYKAEFFQLQPDTSYCFRLKEIPSNDEPGEEFERCGYGINTRPTPTFTATPTITPIPTETPIPTSTPFPSPLPTSPLPTPTPTSTPTVDPTTEAQGGVAVVTAPAPAPTFIVLTATPTNTPVVFAPTPTALPVATPAAILPGFGVDGLLGWSAGAGFEDVMALLFCVGGIGLALLGVMALLGTIFYLRSRM